MDRQIYEIRMDPMALIRPAISEEKKPWQPKGPTANSHARFVPGRKLGSMVNGSMGYNSPT